MMNVGYKNKKPPSLAVLLDFGLVLSTCFCVNHPLFHRHRAGIAKVKEIMAQNRHDCFQNKNLSRMIVQYLSKVGKLYFATQHPEPIKSGQA